MPRLGPVAAALALASCFSRGAIHSYRTEAGRPWAEPGAESYLVWRDRGGWHLRARSDVPHTFHGRVDAGRVTRLAPAGRLPEGAVRAERGGIAFSFVAPGGEEAGFDWDGTACPVLSVYVDDDARPLRVFAGAFGANPPRIPFTICD